MKKRTSNIAYIVFILVALVITVMTASAEDGQVAEGSKKAIWWSLTIRPMIIGLLSGLGTAAIFSLRLSWWLSSWKTDIENRVEHNAERLDSGSESINKIPRLLHRMENLADTLGQTEDKMESLEDKYVRDRECNLKHSRFEEVQENNRERINRIENKIDKLEEKIDS